MERKKMTPVQHLMLAYFLRTLVWHLLLKKYLLIPAEVNYWQEKMNRWLGQ